MYAKFNGTCPRCGMTLRAHSRSLDGTEIANASGEWMCLGCATATLNGSLKHRLDGHAVSGLVALALAITTEAYVSERERRTADARNLDTYHRVADRYLKKWKRLAVSTRTCNACNSTATLDEDALTECCDSDYTNQYELTSAAR